MLTTVFFLLTSQIHWKLPEFCSCGKYVCLMFLLSGVWNPHIRLVVPSCSLLLSAYPAPQPSRLQHSWKMEQTPCAHPGCECECLNTRQCQGCARGAQHYSKLWNTLFQGLLQLLRFGWDQGGNKIKLMFQWPTCLCVGKHYHRDGWLHGDARVIT